MKKHSKIQKILDNTISDLDQGGDIERAKVIVRLIDVKFKGYREQRKYKKLTGKPLKINFFE